MLDRDFQTSTIRPKPVIDLLHKYSQLNDLCLGEPEEDGETIGCFFGASRKKYEHKEGTEYGKLYGTATYHEHELMIRINGKNLFVCKEHLKFLSTLSKELTAFI